MTSLLVWMIMSYGITNIVVYGSIFNTPRNFINKLAENPNTPLNSFWVFIKEMTACPMCFSTWFGFFAGIFLYSPVNIFLEVSPYVSWFLDGMLASGAVWAINSIVEWFEENRN